MQPAACIPVLLGFAHTTLYTVHVCVCVCLYIKCSYLRARGCVYLRVSPYETEIDCVRVGGAEGIQRSGSAAPGSPSVNRDVGTTRPVYISPILTGTSQPGIGAQPRHRPQVRLRTCAVE